MNPVSDNIDERARKIESLIFQRFSYKTATAVAKDTRLSDPTISRLKKDEVKRTSQILASLGLQVVTETTFTVDSEVFKATEALALEYFKVKAEIEKEKDQIIEYYKNKYESVNKKSTG